MSITVTQGMALITNMPPTAPFSKKGLPALKLHMASLIECYENNVIAFATMLQHYHHIMDYTKPISKLHVLLLS